MKIKERPNDIPTTVTISSTMRWPPWSLASNKCDDGKKGPDSWADILNATDWSHYTDPRTVIPTVLLTTTILATTTLYRSYLRRIPVAASVQPTFFRKRSLFGTVTRVGDGDNFHLYHTPGGRLTGWGWLPGRTVPNKRENLKHRTVIRFILPSTVALADIDRLIDSYSYRGR